MSLPKYSIAVASELSGVAQQQLRRLEDGGLLTPGRTAGNTRRYSDDDLVQIGEVTALAEQGVNMEGIRRILRLQEEMRALRAENEALQAQLASVRAEQNSHNEDTQDSRNEENYLKPDGDKVD